jgi:hypothetical protein
MVTAQYVQANTGFLAGRVKRFWCWLDLAAEDDDSAALLDACDNMSAILGRILHEGGSDVVVWV